MLQAWYACRGSTTEVAKRLHCHRNTVRYRLNKVRDLTGRDIADPAESAELHLALRAVALLQPLDQSGTGTGSRISARDSGAAARRASADSSSG
ncbi:helix-turn-helix domain-containing protein [Jongsikchunia kroppenstedtii]|uniref:helix-turn-helix domain-containing protein n=1 Tax=Jongsikchunia kroppenstedtii TaxID=1121721 RepID=UPI001FDF24A1|nr:helix-turn-helix domain-containing protein [Jongsikchunia kroppenstedtii]